MSNKLQVRKGRAPLRRSAFLSDACTPGAFKDIELSPAEAVEMAEALLERVQLAVRPHTLWTLTTHPDYHEYTMLWTAPGGDVQLRLLISRLGMNVWLHDRRGSAEQLCGTAPLASWVVTRLTADGDTYGQLEVCRYDGDDQATALTFEPDGHISYATVRHTFATASAQDELGADIIAATRRQVQRIGLGIV